MSAFRPFMPVTRDFNAPSVGIPNTTGIPVLPGRRTDAQLSNLTNTMPNPLMPNGSNSLTRIDANLPQLTTATTNTSTGYPNYKQWIPIISIGVLVFVLYNLKD